MMLLTAFSVVTIAQNAQSAKPRQNEKTYTLTEKGVDILVYGQRLKTQTPAGSLYDQAVKKYTNDYGVPVYSLKKNGKVIGTAAVSEGKVVGFYFYAPNVQTDNGIHPGTLVVDALKKKGVSATMSFDDMEGDYTIEVYYGNILLIRLVTTDLSANGVKKLTDLEKRTEKWNTEKWKSGYSGDQPTATLGPDDINDIIKIEKIGIGSY